MFIFRGTISTILIASIFCLIGCGTDVKPNYFIGMFRDESDIDRLSSCLTETPVIEDGIVTINSDVQCIVDLSNTDKTDPNIGVKFSEILNDPESYMDKILTFEAIVKIVNAHHLILYTNRHNMIFEIRSHGAEVFTLDEDGEQQELLPNVKYKFKCRITEVKINIHRVWHIYSDFITTQEKNVRKVVFQPELVDSTGD